MTGRRLGWRAVGTGRGDHFGKADVKPVTEGTPPVHVHLLMHLHVNGVMIRVS